jgi:hypothetical protein
MHTGPTQPGQAAPDPLQPVLELLQGNDPELICRKYAITRDELNRRTSDYQASRRRMALADGIQAVKAGRNDPCPCGSGKKYKKCCLDKHQEARQAVPAEQLSEMEARAKAKEKLEKEAKKGFELLFAHDFPKARRFALKQLEATPEDDRFHDILVTADLASGDYDSAFRGARRRWQIAQEEKLFYQENGYHKREGESGSQAVYFYSPSTWLEKFWIAQRARAYREAYPREEGGAGLAKLAAKLDAANDLKRFPEREEEGFEARRHALAPVLGELESAGVAAVPYLLPLTYSFSWASLFVPGLLAAYDTDATARLLAELSMFRFPYFSQKCLSHLEGLGERAVDVIDDVLADNPAFDELKAGLLSVLGGIPGPRSFAILARLTEHENRYIVNWAAEALARHKNPDALPYLERAKERVGALSKIAGAIRELVGEGSAG